MKLILVLTNEIKNHQQNFELDLTTRDCDDSKPNSKSDLRKLKERRTKT